MTVSDHAHPPLPRPTRRGFSLVEGLLSLAIFAAVLAAVNHFVQQGIQEQAARGEATRWVSLTKAADNYVKSQDGVFRAAFAADSAQKIVIPLTGKTGSVALQFPTPPNNLTLQNFKSSNVLGANFQDGDVNNSTAALVVYKPGGLASADYEAVLVGYSPNGKSAIDDKVLVRAEGMSENRVGAWLQSDPTKDVDGAAGPFVRGPRGGWRIPVADLKTGTKIPLNYGHLFSYITMEKRGQNDNSRYLVRSLDANHENNTMETNLDMHGNTVYNVYSLCGTTGEKVQVGGPDATNVDTDCSSSTQIKVGGDFVSNAGFYGAGSVESDSRMVAPFFTDGSTAGPNNAAFFLKPSSTSVLNVVKSEVTQTKWFDIDACAFSSQGDRTSVPGSASPSLAPSTFPSSGCPGSSSTLRLSDLLPKEVVKGTYYATDGSTIAKPSCGTRADGNPAQAKLYASLVRTFSRAEPGITTDVTVNRRAVRVATPDGSGQVLQQSGGGGIVDTNGVDTVQSLEDTSTTKAISQANRITPSAQVEEVTALDQGGQWLIQMPSLVEVPRYNADGTPVLDASGKMVMDLVQQDGRLTGNGDNEPVLDQQNQALIQVACSYQ